jgi:short-subunit dehydrogenase
METILVVGASGNIAASAIIAARRSGRHVLAIVRSQASVEKMYRNVGTSEGITVVEAYSTSEQAMKSVMDRVRKGELPAFQHVYAAGTFLHSTVGGLVLRLTIVHS